MSTADGAVSPSNEGGHRAVAMSGAGAPGAGEADRPVVPAGTAAAPLLTERLRLAPVAEADLAELFALHADPRAFVEDSTAPLTSPEQMALVLAQWRASWERHGIGYRTLRARDGAESGSLLGVAGLTPLSDGRGGSVLSAYWRLSPDHTGRGLAAEAMRAILDAVRAAALPAAALPIVSVTASGNRASLALARRLGFVLAPPDHPVPGDRAGDVLLALPPVGTLQGS